MAQAVASMAGLSPAVLEGSLVVSGASQLGSSAGSSSSSSSSRVALRRGAVVAVRAQRSEESESQSRRSMLGLLAASVAAGALASSARAEPAPPELKPPPPLSGGLPGTDNADQARDTDLPLSERFYIQKGDYSDLVARAKESASRIVGVKELIDKKAWPYVQNELRVSPLNFDLDKILATKPKAEKKEFKALIVSLKSSIDSLDYAAREKSPAKAEKYYNEAVAKLEAVVNKL